MQSTVVDETLLPQPKVTGTVTDPAGKPLANICAAIIGPDWPLGGGCTDAQGHYSVTPTQTGTFAIRFTDNNTPKVYAPRYAGGAYRSDRAAKVTIAPGAVTTVDITLEVGGTITGQAIDARGGGPRADVMPGAYWGRSGGAVTGIDQVASDSNGMYRLGALAPGDLTIQLQPPWGSGMVVQWYRSADTQADATLVSVPLGGSRLLKPVRFLSGGTISGVVTDPAGAPVAGAWIDVLGRFPGRAGPGEGQYVAMTDEQGRYAIKVPPGRYTPLVYTYGSELAPQWVGGATTSASAKPLTVRTGRTTTMNATLRPGAFVTGSMVRPDGSPPGTWVAGTLINSAGDEIGLLDVGPDGAFRSTPLPAGRYLLKAELYGEEGQPVQVFYYDGATTREAATCVKLDVGQTRSIVFHMPAQP